VTPRAAIIAGFVAIAVAAVGAEWFARRRAGIRPAGVTLAAALRSRGGRIAVLAVWLWLGWHFLAR
jgi:hypothetical protein